ncbi:MAG: phage tail protein [Alphaproteobacteria bacterium]|nr:phage tail protein [Alphaproteobacteria bacterium]
MLALARYRFGVWHATYHQLQRPDSWRWSKQQRIGAAVEQHCTGRIPTSISLAGVVFPTFRVGLNLLGDMRATPLRLVAGNGNDMGRWVIVPLTKKQAIFLPAGVPKKITFTINRRQYN